MAFGRDEHSVRATKLSRVREWLHGSAADAVVLTGAGPVAWATGGPVGKAAIIAVFFFVVSSLWSLSRWRRRLRAEARRNRELDL